ncbi:MAG: hypothetical protein ACXWZZ_11165, partial [Solirubrobacteraceae bacterium]
ADEVVCLNIPQQLYSVGSWYEDFSEVSDDEVTTLLEAAARRRAWSADRRWRARSAWMSVASGSRAISSCRTEPTAWCFRPRRRQQPVEPAQ